MPLHYPPFVVLWTYYDATAGHDINPARGTLEAFDNQLFSTWDQVITFAMAQFGIPAGYKPVLITLADIAPGVSLPQRAQSACAFFHNAMLALQRPIAGPPPNMLLESVPRKPRRKKTGRKRKGGSKSGK
jgi:hypothetical protein